MNVTIFAGHLVPVSVHTTHLHLYGTIAAKDNMQRSEDQIWPLDYFADPTLESIGCHRYGALSDLSAVC